MAKFQTLDEFLRNPFGKSTDVLKTQKYQLLYNKNTDRIRLKSYTQIDDSYYFHVIVPSSTNQKDDKVYYDVVIRFFTDKPESLKSSHIRDYYIQFFSNSPGFIYKYAVLYKNHGYLIEFLYNKLDPEYFDKLPEKANSNMDLSFDRSIYFACKYLSERKFRVLNKVGISVGKKLDPDIFFRNISDFKTATFNNELRTLSKKSLSNLDKDLEKNVISNRNLKQRMNDNHRKSASKSTSGTVTSKIFGKKSNNKVNKKVAKKSTYRK